MDKPYVCKVHGLQSNFYEYTNPRTGRRDRFCRTCADTRRKKWRNTTGTWTTEYKCGSCGGTDYYVTSSGSTGYVRRCRACNVQGTRKQYAIRRADPVKWAKVLKATAADKRKRKLELISAYGGQCTCCGETHWEFLTVEHINGDGAKHRREVGPNMSGVLKRLGWPKEGFSLLCMNCNFSRGKFGYCPHQQAKEVT